MTQKVVHAYIYRDLTNLRHEFRDKESDRLVRFLDPETYRVAGEPEFSLVVQQLLKEADTLQNYGLFERDSVDTYFIVEGNIFVESEREIDFLLDQDFRISNTPVTDQSVLIKSPTWRGFKCYLTQEGDYRLLRDKHTNKRIVFAGMPTADLQRFHKFIGNIEQAQMRPGAYFDRDEKQEYVVLEGDVVDETREEIFVKFNPSLRYYLT